jgi:lipoate-protein ligase A
MGVSGKPELLLNVTKVEQDQIPILHRRSGGGTVIVDKDTLFISFIFSKTTLDIHPFPEPILRWSEQLYIDSWRVNGFRLIENDYAIGHVKCGGNAQYITKDRWLHHTSFLWDYQDENMEYLLLPPKRPKYRGDRPHGEFLCRLKDFATSQEALIDALTDHLSKHFQIEKFSPDAHNSPS